MTKERLIEKIDSYLNACDNADTWYSSDLVEDALSLLESCKEFLQNEN